MVAWAAPSRQVLALPFLRIVHVPSGFVPAGLEPIEECR